MTHGSRQPAHASSREPAEDSTHRLLESGARLVAKTPASGPQSIALGAADGRIGPYHVVCELASGGMASVYLALHRSVEGFEKLVAVKRIHPHLASERAFTEMFVDEARIAARISHPYVCSVFSFGRGRDSHYIAMEFLRGEPLSAVQRRVTAKPELADDARYPLLIARVLANLAEGLHAAHVLRDERGQSLEVVHRDVTPQNLFVIYDGSVRVTDFGIAQARQRLHHTQDQRLKGKLSYIAPELLNRAPATAQVDVWGLGVVLWELLAGRRLFLGSSEGQTVAAVMSRPVVAPSTFRASIPAELDRIVLRALERDLVRRYQSARDLARDLESFLKASGDAVPSMDVAEWMTRVFPEGAQRVQGLLELAAQVSLSTAEVTVVRVPSSPPAKAALDVSLPALPQLPAPKLEPEPRPVVSQALAEPEARRSRSPRWLAAGLLVLASLGVAFSVRALGHSKSEPATVRPMRSGLAESPVIGQPLTTAPVEVTAAPSEPVVALDSLPVLPEEPPAARAPRPSLAAKVAREDSSDSAAPAPALHDVPTIGDLYVTSPGASGQAVIDGHPAGRVPGRFRLPLGSHDLLVKGDSGATKHLSIEITNGSPALLTVDLAP